MLTFKLSSIILQSRQAFHITIFLYDRFSPFAEVKSERVKKQNAIKFIFFLRYYTYIFEKKKHVILYVLLVEINIVKRALNILTLVHDYIALNYRFMALKII